MWYIVIFKTVERDSNYPYGAKLIGKVTVKSDFVAKKIFSALKNSGYKLTTAQKG